MTDSKPSRGFVLRKLAAVVLVVFMLVAATGCGIFKTKKTVSVPVLLPPLAKADTAQLFAEINRLAVVQSIRGKIDVQFLDTSFAECGLVDKYREADGDIIVQRPGQIYLAIKAPFGVKIAEMTSTGERFWVAIYQGDARYRRFVTGRNEAAYGKLSDDGNGGQTPCGSGDKSEEKSMRRTVSSLSSMRPQHLTDALMVRPVTGETAARYTYALSEDFVEEPDTRSSAKKNTRVVRGYYILVELEPLEQNRARVMRRFWFDRTAASVRLARVQNYDATGQLITDVVYRDPKPLGAEGRLQLPGAIELTRPQDRYSLRITFQSPEEVVIDKQFDPDIFILQNTSDLQEVDLDKQKK